MVGGLLYIQSHQSDLKNPSQSIQPTIKVKAQDYQQFWIWNPPKDSAKLQSATTLYILQGEIRVTNGVTLNSQADRSQATLTPQGMGVKKLANKKIWLVYRVDNRVTAQDWSQQINVRIQAKLHAWEQAGNQVEGIQIDFDSPTYQLDNYAKLLTTIRKQLPKRYKLSVTGLLDWANQAQNREFLQIGNSIDELVMQTYQGTTTLPNYQQYLRKLEKLPFDFKIGLVEQGEWQGADFVEQNPHFKGYVVFVR